MAVLPELMGLPSTRVYKDDVTLRFFESSHTPNDLRSFLMQVGIQ